MQLMPIRPKIREVDSICRKKGIEKAVGICMPSGAQHTLGNHCVFAANESISRFNICSVLGLVHLARLMPLERRLLLCACE
jgi:hypothetical protein